VSNSRLSSTNVVSVRYAASRLSISRQRVHQLMNQGKLAYVTLLGQRLPAAWSVESRCRDVMGKKGESG
jgi:hypothetical protein